MAALSTLAAVGAGLVGSYLLKPKTPKGSAPAPTPITPPPDPVVTQRAAMLAAQQAASARARREGSTAGTAGASTILTSPSGVTTPVPVQRKLLLGL